MENIKCFNCNRSAVTEYGLCLRCDKYIGNAYRKKYFNSIIDDAEIEEVEEIAKNSDLEIKDHDKEKNNLLRSAQEAIKMGVDLNSEIYESNKYLMSEFKKSLEMQKNLTDKLEYLTNHTQIQDKIIDNMDQIIKENEKSVEIIIDDDKPKLSIRDGDISLKKKLLKKKLLKK